MIPKIIHYCWLSGDPIPADLQRYMKTWKKYLSDYELILWDTNRFPLEQSKWVKEAFEQKKYAFAADYIRLYALYHYGGIYLDMDVEVLKSFNPLLHLPMMLGFDHHEKHFEVATWGCEKNHPALKSLLAFYDTRSFINTDGSLSIETMPPVVSRILLNDGYSFANVDSIDKAEIIFNNNEKEIPIFPRTWFCPRNWYTYKLDTTRETFSIHQYKGSWLPKKVRRERDLLSKLGPYLPAIWRKVQQVLHL
ncbi:MAG: glycosyltransferase family 32 protein [Phocaeicola sp.]